MAYTGKNPRFTSVLLTDALSSTPSSPPSSAHKLIDRNGQLFLMDSNGVETPVGGGAGEKNYILSPSTAVSWVASSAAITVATDTTVADLPRGLTTKTGILITGVSGSTAYARYRFTLDQADYNRKLKIKFDLKPVSGYVASDMKVDLYSNTASNYGGTSTRITTSSDSSSICAIPNMTGQFQTTVDMPGSTAPYMELRVGLNATSTQAIVISDVVVGPGLQPQGAVVEDARTVTVTTSASNVSVAASRTRIGQWAKFQILATFSGASSGALTFTLPTGNTIDTSVSGITTGASLGVVKWDDNGVGDFGGVVRYASTTTVGVSIDDQSGAYDSGPTFASGDLLGLEFFVPIAEWAGSGTVNLAQNDVEYASNSSVSTTTDDLTSFDHGPAGNEIKSITSYLARRVRFQSPIQIGDKIEIELSTDRIKWAPVIGTLALDGTNRVNDFRVQNSSVYGVGQFSIINATDVSVFFGQYAAESGATYGSAGTAWSAGGGTWYWRVKKSSSGQAVGFGNVAQNTSGLVKSAGQLLGTNTDDVAASGYVGETARITRLRSNALSLSTATAANVCTTTNLVLQPGDYDIGAIIIFQSPNTTVVSELSASISSTSATNSGTDTIGVPTDGECRVIDANPYTSSGTTHSTLVIPPYPVSVAGGTTKTLYLVTECTFSVSTLTCYGSMYYRRVR